MHIFRDNFQRIFVLSVLLASLFLTGCSSNPNKDAVASGAAEDSELVNEEEKNIDPLEGFNRKVFSFNMTLDRWVLKPVAKGYAWLAPEPVEIGVGNFFSNLGEVKNVFNDVLQWKWKQAGNDTGRFLINTTVGGLGLFDVASKAGLEKSEGEDFGQTLATWGVPQGPYLVMPFMGPTTLRDGPASIADFHLDPITYVEPQSAENALSALQLIHDRAGLLEQEKMLTEEQRKTEVLYVFLRDLYLQRREYLINDGVVEDDFGADFDEEDF